MFKAYARGPIGTLIRLLGIGAFFLVLHITGEFIAPVLTFIGFWIWGGYSKYQSRQSVRVVEVEGK